MAIFHLCVKTISRSAGRSATAAIAYRVGEKVTDERTGLIHNYTRKRGVEHAEIFLPKDAPIWASDRGALWNAAEKSENRKNSTVAREFEVALPAELNAGQRRALVGEFASELVSHHGMAVDVAIHEPGREGDNRNHHAHILCSTRRLTAEGFKDKTRELDDLKTGPKEIEHWRARWAEVSNRHLEQAGRNERIDHRSLAAQRVAAIESGDADKAAELDRRPTVHLGPNVVQMTRRGIDTDRADQNREANKYNALIIDLAEVRRQIEALKAQGHEQSDDTRGIDRAANEDRQQPARQDTGRPGQDAGKVDIGRAEQVQPRDASPTDDRPADPRELLQREVNAAQLRDVLKRREELIVPRDAANDPGPAKIEAEWKAEKARQLVLVVNKARRIEARAAGQIDRQEEKLAGHDKARPAQPTGLFAGLMRAAYDKAATAWQGVRAGMERRFNQLRDRLNLIGGYVRRSGAYEFATAGERLAERKAADARPELAASVRKIEEQRKAAAIAAQRAKIEQRQQGRKDRTAMKQESIEETKQRTDANRLKAEQAKRAELEKAGRLASTQNELLGDKPVNDTTSATTGLAGHQNFLKTIGQGQQAMAHEATRRAELGAKVEQPAEQSKDARRREMLERFKEKAARDRDNDKGRGR